MRASYLTVLLTLAAIVGCDMIKEHMPAPTANKAVNVPANAGLVAYGVPDLITLPANSPGAYYVVEDDTSRIVNVFNVVPPTDSATAFTPAMKNDLDAKRKYKIYYVSNADAKQPTTIPMK